MRKMHTAHRQRGPHFLRSATAADDRASSSNTEMESHGATDMNPECSCCGAIMSAVREADETPASFMCKQCGNAFFSNAPDHESPAATQDGVVGTGEQLTTCCPVCRDCPLSGGVIEDHRVLYCQQCSGVLISNRNFSEVLARLRRAGGSSGSDKDPQPIDPSEFQRQIGCPNCSNRMDVHPYYGPGNVVIDSCCRCFLIWFDQGEIATIKDA